MPPIRLLAIIEAATITGPAKNLLQFAEFARAPGYDPPVNVSIAVFQRPNASELFLETARRCSIPVYPIAERGRFDHSVMAALFALTESLRPDVIQSHAVKSHFLVRQAGIHKIAPWIAFHHGYTWPDLRARLYNQLDRWSLRAASQVLTVSLPFRDELTRNGVSPKRIQVIHNAIDPQWGAPGRCPESGAEVRARLGIPPDSKVILIVGRLSREKDHRTLIEAVGRLNSVPGAPRPHLLIVGEGPERAALESLVGSLNLGALVTFTGQVPSAEPYYGAADLAVLSSLSEGSPNALLEAMAARIPVVATKVGGIPEIVSDGQSALLIAPGDRAAMTEAIAALLVDENLGRQLTACAYQLILARHTPESRIRSLIGVYRQVLAAER